MNRDSLFISHILQETKFILENTEGMTFSEFLENKILQKAVVQSFGVIGEGGKL